MFPFYPSSLALEKMVDGQSEVDWEEEPVTLDKEISLSLAVFFFLQLILASKDLQWFGGHAKEEEKT